MTGLYVASNAKALGSQITLQRNVNSLSETLTRLSTGLKINSGKDDPAGLIASELLKSDITATKSAIQNTQRANSIIAVADSALGQVSSLLNDIRSLVNQSANTGAMTDDQISANQLQVDASIDSIDRIAQTTNFQGKKLLDGSMDFRTSAGTNSNKLSNVEITSANFGTRDAVDVNVKLLEEAKTAKLQYNGTGVSEDTIVRIGGSQGSEIFKFGAGATTQDMADLINASTDTTGLVASVSGEATKGIVELNGVGANNSIVITANDTGEAAGNYSFKIVSGDTNGVRIASQATDGSAGVVEIMLQKGYSKTHQNVGGMLDVTINGTSAADASGVTIKKGTANTAQYYEADSAATATTTDGLKTITVQVSATAAQAAGVLNTDISQLNGWTFKVAADGDVINGQTLAASGAIYDDESKIAYLSNTGLAADTAPASLLAAVNRITGNGNVVDATGIAVTGTLAVGDTFTLGGGGAEGELELTYKEGATVNDLLKLANDSGGASASLASGVDGNALVKDVLSGNSRSFASGAAAMTESSTTSSVTANDVIQMINSTLGDKFNAVLATGDSGTGLMTYMDAAVTTGDVNMDNAVRFTGMDSGPVVRMVTTDSEGKPISDQKLSVSLLNPTEADIANGITTKVLQINLATDKAGNSITTAQDIVDLFNSLTADQTGGISATLVLPDGVDPNGRTWTVDNCNNLIETTDCNASYGFGIVQPTGVPGNCEVQQNDLKLLGTNQNVVDDYAVARIGSVTDHAAFTPLEAMTTNSANNTITTTSNHSGLAGVTINFVTDDNQAGFDETTGTLKVFLSPSTQAAVTNDLLTDAVNGAIAQNWQGIRQFNGATGDATKVTVDTDATDGAGAVAAFNTNAATFASDTVTASATNTRGVNATDAALEITALAKGTDMAGVKVVLEDDASMTAFTADGANAAGSLVNVTFDKDNGVLTIKANGSAGISAGALAKALNENETFQKNFSASANTILGGADPTANAGEDDDWSVVYFGTGAGAATTFTGGTKIETAEKAIGGAANNAETSAGIGMTGNNDENLALVISATESGSGNYVNVDVISGSFRTFCPLGLEMSYLAGTDAKITVNGQKASTDGDNFSVSSSTFAMTGTVNGMKEGETASFKVTDGGATFQLGPDVVSAQQIRVGIKSVDSTTLGGSTGRLYQLKSGENADLKTDTKLADRIVQEAINSIAVTRGRLGSVQRSTLEPNQAVLEDTVEQLTAAEAIYSNADFAEESSNLTRAQILVQSSSQALALSNQFPQYAAQLVG